MPGDHRRPSLPRRRPPGEPPSPPEVARDLHGASLFQAEPDQPGRHPDRRDDQSHRRPCPRGRHLFGQVANLEARSGWGGPGGVEVPSRRVGREPDPGSPGMRQPDPGSSGMCQPDPGSSGMCQPEPPVPGMRYPDPRSLGPPEGERSRRRCGVLLVVHSPGAAAEHHREGGDSQRGEGGSPGSGRHGARPGLAAGRLRPRRPRQARRPVGAPGRAELARRARSRPPRCGCRRPAPPGTRRHR